MDLYDQVKWLIKFIEAKVGLHQIWQNEASPTCRFGVMKSIKKF